MTQSSAAHKGSSDPYDGDVSFDAIDAVLNTHNKTKSSFRAKPPALQEIERVDAYCEPISELTESFNEASEAKLAKEPSKKYQCEFCLKCFRSKGHLKDHRRIHTNEKPYSCPSCNITFRQKSHMYKHLERGACGKSSKSARKEKQDKSGESGKGRHTCSVCNKSFKRKLALTNHIKTHLTPNNDYEKPEKDILEYFEDISDDFLNTAEENDVSDMITPIKRTPESVSKTGTNPQKPYECEVCNKGFRMKSHLTDHRRIHTGEKPFACPQCDKTFRQKSALTQHLLSACQKRLFRDDNETPKTVTAGKRGRRKIKNMCGVCSKIFTSKNALEKHMKTHEISDSVIEENAMLELENMPDFSALAQDDLQLTILKQEPEVADDSSPTKNGHAYDYSLKYTCHFCQKRFSRRGQLIKHLRSHKDEKSPSNQPETHYKCTLCDKIIDKENDIEKHVHSHEKKFKCAKCGMVFFEDSELKAHTGSPVCMENFANLLTVIAERSICLQTDEDISNEVKTKTEKNTDDFVNDTNASSVRFEIDPNIIKKMENDSNPDQTNTNISHGDIQNTTIDDVNDDAIQGYTKAETDDEDRCLRL